MPTTFTEPVYSLREAAELLGIGLKTVEVFIRRKLISAEKISESRGARVITASELRRFERERKPVGNPNLNRKRESAEKF